MKVTYSFLLICVSFGFVAGTVRVPQDVAAVTEALATEAAASKPSITKPDFTEHGGSLFKCDGTSWNPFKSLALSKRAESRTPHHVHHLLQHAQIGHAKLVPKKPRARFDDALRSQHPNMHERRSMTTPPGTTEPEPWVFKRANTGGNPRSTGPLSKRARSSLVAPEDPRQKHAANPDPKKPLIIFDGKDPSTEYFKSHDSIRPEHWHWKKTVCNVLYGACTRARVRMLRGPASGTAAGGVPKAGVPAAGVHTADVPAGHVPEGPWYAEVSDMDRRFMGAFKKVHVFHDGTFVPVPPKPSDIVGHVLKPSRSQLPSAMENWMANMAWRKRQEETKAYWVDHPLGPHPPWGWYKDYYGVWRDRFGTADRHVPGSESS